MISWDLKALVLGLRKKNIDFRLNLDEGLAYRHQVIVSWYATQVSG